MDHNNLEEYREWFGKTHTDRELATERLEQILDDVDAELEQWEDLLEERSNNPVNQYLHATRPGEAPNPNEREKQRYYRELWRWKWDIERKLRDLVRGERDDLGWLDKLEGRQRARERAMERLTRSP